MLFFEECYRYEVKTGKKYSRLEWVGHICDFCGKIHRFEDTVDGLEFGDGNSIFYRIEDYSNIEQSYYYDEFLIPKEWPAFNAFDLNAQHDSFYYCQDYETGEPICEPHLFLTVSPKTDSIARMMYDARYNAILFSVKNFGLKFENLGLNL